MSNNVPKLRFKGFECEWEEQKLGSLGQFFKGNGISKSDLSESGKECILYGELYTRYGEVIKKIHSKTELEFKGQVLSKANDVLIPSSGETAIDIATASCVQKDNILLGGDLNIFRPNYINGVFISYELNSSKRNEIAKVAQGASVVHIYNDQLKKILVNIPSIEEQEKIANFLTKVDKIIEKQEEKVSNLENYKKGMMQKIFSQEIRFKDENGEEYPLWEKKKLGDFIVEYTEKTTVNNQYQALTSSRRGLFLQSEYFNKQIASEDNTGYNIVPRGYFTYRHMSDDSIFYFNINDILDLGIVSTLYPVFTVKNMNSNFLRYYLNDGPTFRKYCLLQKQGGSRTYMYLKKLREFEGDLPCLEEQTKITNFLSNIDRVVEKEKEKLEELRLWKKGLLQQMFV